MRILKFGGTSLADVGRIDRAAALVQEASVETRVVVVASAIAGVTNQLVGLVARPDRKNGNSFDDVDRIEGRHLEILEALSGSGRAAIRRSIVAIVEALRSDIELLEKDPLDRAEITDRIVAGGERLSVQLVAAALRSRGSAARVVDAADAVVTDSSFGEARVDLEATRDRCRRVLSGRDRAIPVVTGFIGADAHGRTTTIGRGGSDYTAAVLGGCLGVDRVEIWTDVDGVLTAPPQLVPSVSTIPWLSYEEAAELSFYGAKVLHPKTIRPLAERGIPIHVRNTLAPARRCTEIAARTGGPSRVVAVSAYEDVSVEYRKGGEVPTNALMSCRASADGMTLVAFPSPKPDSPVLPAGDRLRSASIVTLVGHDIAAQPWVAGRALESLARRGIAVRSFAAGAGPHTVALLIDRDELEAALCAVHDALMLDRETVSSGRGGSLAGRRKEQQTTAA
jgi:aspartate kinase